MLINLKKLIGDQNEFQVQPIFSISMVWLVLASASIMSLIIWKCAHGVQQKEADAAEVYGGSSCAAACGAGCGA